MWAPLSVAKTRACAAEAVSKALADSDNAATVVINLFMGHRLYEKRTGSNAGQQVCCMRVGAAMQRPGGASAEKKF
jgi:hypothetical protein